MSRKSSMFLDYQRWLEARGLLLLPIDANPDDTLQIPQQFSAPETSEDEADDAEDMSREYSCSCGFLVANCRYGTWQCKQDDGADDDANDLPLPFEE